MTSWRAVALLAPLIDVAIPPWARAALRSPFTRRASDDASPVRPPRISSFRGLLCGGVIAGGIAGSSLVSVAQTNSSLPNMQWFAVSAPQLRTESAATAKPATQEQKAGAAAPPTTSATAEPQVPPASSFSVSVSREDMDLYRAYRNFGLIQPPVLVSRDPLTRGLEAVFRPEEFHLGRTATFSCSLATAIKRRDPLCLLNPTFLNLSW